jgi:hypothetical protein
VTRDLTTALLRLSATTQDAYVAAKMSGNAELAAKLLETAHVVNAALREAAMAAEGSGLVSKRISKKVREEAAMLCAGFASTQAAYVDWDASEADETVTTSNAAVRLANAAYWYVASELHLYDRECGDAPTSTHLEAYAEAEALLRTGWSPS